MKERLSFRAALIEVKAAEFDAIPDKLSFRPSFAFLRKMRVLLRSRREPLLPPVRIGLKKAIVIAIVAAMIAALPLASGAVRQAIGGFFSEILDSIGASLYEVDDTGKEMQDSIKTVYTLSLVPDGYEQDSRKIVGRSVKSQWSNGERVIDLTQSANPKFTINHDTENIVVEEIVTADLIATYFEGKGYRDIMWVQDGYTFVLRVQDDVAKETLVRMAISCVPVS